MKYQKLKVYRDKLTRLIADLEKASNDAVGTDFFFQVSSTLLEVEEAQKECEKSIEELKSQE